MSARRYVLIAEKHFGRVWHILREPVPGWMLDLPTLCGHRPRVETIRRRLPSRASVICGHCARAAAR